MDPTGHDLAIIVHCSVTMLPLGKNPRTAHRMALESERYGVGATEEPFETRVERLTTIRS